MFLVTSFQVGKKLKLITAHAFQIYSAPLNLEVVFNKYIFLLTSQKVVFYVNGSKLARIKTIVRSLLHFLSTLYLFIKTMLQNYHCTSSNLTTRRAPPINALRFYRVTYGFDWDRILRIEIKQTPLNFAFLQSSANVSLLGWW